jgi:MFS family permease
LACCHAFSDALLHLADGLPTLQFYTMAVVSPDERSVTSGITTIACSLGAAVSPSLLGLLLSVANLMSLPFLIGGGLKIVYDLLRFKCFRAAEIPEEKKDGAI